MLKTILCQVLLFVSKIYLIWFSRYLQIELILIRTQVNIHILRLMTSLPFLTFHRVLEGRFVHWSPLKRQKFIFKLSFFFFFFWFFLLLFRPSVSKGNLIGNALFLHFHYFFSWFFFLYKRTLTNGLTDISEMFQSYQNRLTT